MKLAQLLFGIALVLAADTVNAIGLLHKIIIPDLNHYNHVSPIITPDGSYQGLVATESSGKRVDLFNRTGAMTDSMFLQNYCIMSLARLSENGDSIIVYSLQDTTGTVYINGSNVTFSFPRLTVTTIVGELVASETIDPAVYTYGGGGNTEVYISVSSSIAFEFDNEFRPTKLLLKSGFSVSVSEMTIGTTTSKGQNYIAYSLDLATDLVRIGVGNYVTGDFGSPESCGSAYTNNSYYSVYDDPDNSYSSFSTRFRVINCDSTIGNRVDSKSSQYLFAGNFLTNTGTDELIYVGSMQDLLGLHDSAESHWACYRIDENVISEAWYIPSPRGFEPYQYLPHRNGIIGIVFGLTVRTLDCATGGFVDSIPLGHTMLNRTFLPDASRSYPDLFGRLGDTAFVYDLNTPTDAGSDPDNSLPASFVLDQNYPNPFNPTTTISFSLPEASDITLAVYNILGRRVTMLADGSFPAGTHMVSWGGRDDRGKAAASGIYLYRLQTDEFSLSRKMLLLK
jgi:hypothetical protein